MNRQFRFNKKADALRFLLMTGARRNEVLQARWNSIDLDKEQWYLPNTKSGKSRFILLNDGAIELLRQRSRPAGHLYVFPGKNVGEPICNPYKGLKRVLEERRSTEAGQTGRRRNRLPNHDW